MSGWHVVCVGISSIVQREAAKLAAQEQKEQQAAAAAATPAAKKEYNDARLQVMRIRMDYLMTRILNDAIAQFRVPGVAPITQTFPADTTLQQVHEFLQSKGCNQPFALSMTFPRQKSFAMMHLCFND